MRAVSINLSLIFLSERAVSDEMKVQKKREISRFLTINPPSDYSSNSTDKPAEDWYWNILPYPVFRSSSKRRKLREPWSAHSAYTP